MKEDAFLLANGRLASQINLRLAMTFFTSYLLQFVLYAIVAVGVWALEEKLNGRKRK